MSTIRRVGAFLEVLDEDGCRHLLRFSTIQAVSDTDPLQNETLITAAGRTIRVNVALDDIVAMLATQEAVSQFQLVSPVQGHTEGRFRP
jgi:hypothetical protein